MNDSRICDLSWSDWFMRNSTEFQVKSSPRCPSKGKDCIVLWHKPGGQNCRLLYALRVREFSNVNTLTSICCDKLDLHPGRLQVNLLSTVKEGQQAIFLLSPCVTDFLRTHTTTRTNSLAVSDMLNLPRFSSYVLSMRIALISRL